MLSEISKQKAGYLMISHTRYMLKEIIEQPSTHKTLKPLKKRIAMDYSVHQKNTTLDELSFNSETQIEGQPTNFFYHKQTCIV